MGLRYLELSPAGVLLLSSPVGDTRHDSVTGRTLGRGCADGDGVKKLPVALLLLAGAGLTLAACNDKDTKPVVPVEVPTTVTSISPSPYVTDSPVPVPSAAVSTSLSPFPVPSVTVTDSPPPGDPGGPACDAKDPDCPPDDNNRK